MFASYRSATTKFAIALKHGWRVSSFTSDGAYLEHKRGRGKVFHLNFDGSICVIPF